MNNFIKCNIIFVLGFGSICYGETVVDDDRVLLEKTYPNGERINTNGYKIYVAGEIKNPKEFDVDDSNVITLNDVIESCGGMSEVASNNMIFLVRDRKMFRIYIKYGNFDRIRLHGGDLVFFPHKFALGK